MKSKRSLRTTKGMVKHHAVRRAAKAFHNGHGKRGRRMGVAALNKGMKQILAIAARAVR